VSSIDLGFLGAVGGASVLLPLLLLGGWVALDHVSLGQFMVSRPMVSGTLAGALAGDPMSGILAGGLLELLHVASFPVGAVRLAEPGPGGVVAGFTAASFGGGGGLALGVGVGIGVAQVAGWSMQWHRRQNQLRVDRVTAVISGRGTRLSLRQALARALVADALRGFLLVAGGVGVALALAPVLVAAWPLSRPLTVALLCVPSAFSLGALGRVPLMGGARQGLILLLSGILIGGMAVFLLSPPAVALFWGGGQ
jgi:hypothetical protein